MRIVSIGYPLLPVSADSAGGAEQILYLVERGARALGHSTAVIAATGSRISGELIETPAATGEITPELRAHAHAAHRAAIAKALKRWPDTLLHFHGLDFHQYVPAHPAPKLATLHLPIDWYPRSIFDTAGIQLNAVSEAQAQSAPSRRRLPIVGNGVDLERYAPSSDAARDYLLWLGRVCPEKGVDIALRAAHRAGMRLIVAGPVHPFREHRAYFEDCVKPLLDARREYIGAVDMTAKPKLLAEAACLLVTSLVAETSSLVAMESISSGTPVVAFRRGALPEIVRHGETGFIVDEEEAIADALARARNIDAHTCREHAQRRFDANRMVRDYVELYARVGENATVTAAAK